MATYYCTIDLDYNANGGSGAPSAQSVTEAVSSFPANVYLRLSSKTPTRSGYTFMGWARSRTASTADYTTGDLYVHTFQDAGSWTATLYAVWKENAQQSTITSLTSSVPIDGTTTGTLVLSRTNTSYLHQVVISYGSYSQTFNNVGQGQSGTTVSMTFTIPTSWLSGLPNSTSGTATCTVKTFSGSSLVGSSVSKTFTITVPSSVKPTASLSGSNQSSNSTVSGWGILLQGYSTIKLTATATAGQGATVSNISFSGDGVSASGSGLTTTSEILTTTGNRTWKVTVTDSRGRSTSATLSRTVYAYNNPSASLSAFRSTNTGVSDDTAGTYINAKATYSYASCNGHNTVSAKIQYKQHTASSWTNGKTSAASGTAYTFGGGNISVLYQYDVRVVVTDALNNSATRSVSVASVAGFSFGLNGKCARFGGPVQYDDRFECDWDTVIHGDLTVDGSINNIGENQSTTPDSSSLANNSWVGKASLTFSPGVYVLEGGCRFAANANGYRAVVLASSNNSSTILTRGARTVTPAIDGVAVVATFTMIREFTEQTTLYVNAYQNSGSALTVYPWFRSVRIY